MKKRTIEIKLRLTPEEAKSLNDAVVSTGRSRESYLRYELLSNEDMERYFKQLEKEDKNEKLK